MKIERALYLMARKDLLAAEVLYDNKKYPQAMFYFQQAVEKANKVLGLLEEIIKPEDLKEKVGHDPIALYKRSLVMRKAQVDGIILTAKQHPRLKKHHFYRQVRDHAEDINKGEKFLQALRENKDKKLLKISRDDLYYCLDQMAEVYYADSMLPENFDIKEAIDYRYKLIEAVNPEAALKERTELEALLQDPKNKEEYIKGIQLIVDRVHDMAFITCTLYFCAIVTLPHAIKARYPEPDMSFNPLTFYTRKLPLVDLQAEFIWYMKKALRMLPAFYYKELQKETSQTNTAMSQQVS
jgi:hypothetical protein